MDLNDKDFEKTFKETKKLLETMTTPMPQPRLKFPQYVQFRDYLIIGQSKEHILTSVSRILTVGPMGLYIVDKLPGYMKDRLRMQEIEREGNKEWEEIESLINKKVHDWNEKEQDEWNARQAKRAFDRLSPEEQKEVRAIHRKTVREALRGNI